MPDVINNIDDTILKLNPIDNTVHSVKPADQILITRLSDKDVENLRQLFMTKDEGIDQYNALVTKINEIGLDESFIDQLGNIFVTKIRLSQLVNKFDEDIETIKVKLKDLINKTDFDNKIIEIEEKITVEFKTQNW